MALTRREFLKLCGGSAAALGISQTLVPDIASALEKAAAGKPPVLWLAGSACTGCSVSLLNTVHPDIKDVLLKVISLRYHQTVMAASGDLAIKAIEDTAKEAKGKYLLLVEGGIATAQGGLYNTIGEHKEKGITMVEWTKRLGENAAAAVSIGTCAAYGGIPAARPNPTGVKPVGQIFKEAGIKTPVINVPGCPPHPDWMVGTLAHVLLYGVPELDSEGRPTLFFGETIHDNCPYRGYFDEGVFAKKFGDPGCRFNLGCKGPETYADCWKRRWNNGVNWCVQNAICTGCVQPGYPDETSPMYESIG